MTRKVVGDQVQEDTVKTYTREEAERALNQCVHELPRIERQVKTSRENFAKCEAEIVEWEALISQLPALPVADPGPDPVRPPGIPDPVPPIA
jgi:hypothetical protein